MTAPPRPARLKPAVRAYMMSLLAVRKLQLAGQFAAKFPHPWLLWEPGVWQPAKGASSPTLIGGVVDVNARPGQGDALCFELIEPRALKVGRAPECDIVLNDATVSREHLLLEPSGTGWRLKTTGATTASVNEHPVSAAGTELRSRDKVRLGDVTLTYYASAELISRLDETIAKSQQP